MNGTHVPGWLRISRKRLGPQDISAVASRCCWIANSQRTARCCDDCCEGRRVGVVSVRRGQLALRGLEVHEGETPGPRALREGFRSRLALSRLSFPQLSLET